MENILRDMFISTTNIKNCKISAVLNQFLITFIISTLNIENFKKKCRNEPKN
jgi:hypothetical protein